MAKVGGSFKKVKFTFEIRLTFHGFRKKKPGKNRVDKTVKSGIINSRKWVGMRMKICEKIMNCA